MEAGRVIEEKKGRPGCEHGLGRFGNCEALAECELCHRRFRWLGAFPELPEGVEIRKGSSRHPHYFCDGCFRDRRSEVLRCVHGR